MDQRVQERTSPLLLAANALVRLHKEHFGRGPTNARAYFAGPDMLVCAMADALLPAERKMTGLGLQEQVRHSRVSFQAACQEEFISTVEEIVGRQVMAFASAIDPDNGVVFENFLFVADGAADHHFNGVHDGSPAGSY